MKKVELFIFVFILALLTFALGNAQEVAPVVAPAAASFFSMQNIAIIMGVLFGISEALSMIPQIKSSGVFQMIYNILKVLTGKKDEPVK